MLIFIQKLLSPDKYKSENRVTERGWDNRQQLKSVGKSAEKKTQKWPKVRKEMKFCICTHDLIRIYTDVVVGNKQ